MMKLKNGKNGAKNNFTDLKEQLLDYKLIV